jgi:tetratricopeptide (TPR) repeat protein
MEDLKIKCFCPADELVGASETQAKEKGRLRSYQTGDFVCVVILEVKRDVQRLLVSMKCNTLLDPESAERKCKNRGIQLGLVSTGLSNLPLTYQKTLQATDKNLQYDKLLEKSEGFSNPTSVEVLAEEIGLPNLAGDATLMSNFGPFRKNSYATQLRKRQNANASYRHVSQGVKHFKAGQNSEAFQCLNAALRIDEDNVEGFVARGALYANNGSLQKAIDDFEAALKIKETHKNAQKYLHETLMAIAQNYEDDRNFVLARDTYTKVLSRDPDCHRARKKLYPLLVSYGKEMERERNFEDAVNAYSNAMSIDKTNKEAKCLLVSLKMHNKGTFIDQYISKKLDR